MTIGEKIARLRAASRTSQEQLAEKLSVSRQSVSKWEMDLALPQIDKVLMICDLFGISADELLREEMPLTVDRTDAFAPAAASRTSNRYFGTEGFRGEANVTLTPEHAYRIGRFLGWYYASPLSGCRKPGYRPRIVIGKDTRRSSYMLEYSIAAGITASGADACMLHVITTPGVSYVTRQDEFDCGIMITASHDPYYNNGIKLMNRYGERADEGTLSLIEAYLDGNMKQLGTAPDLPLARRERMGCIMDCVAGRNRYVGYLISVAAHSYKNMRIGLDCANGAAWMIAKAVFDALGAQTYLTGAQPDGTNINEDCGTENLSRLCAFVRENHLDAGFAFDGDSDRCVAVDENGDVVGGDKILFILARRLKSRDILSRNTVVTTETSNTGLFRALEREGIGCELTSVGDRFVYGKMQDGGYSLGGEAAGHVIMKKYATTGDGLLTAIMLCEEMRDRKAALSALAAGVTLLPQKTKTVPVTDKAGVMKDPEVCGKYAELSRTLKDRGRILLRPSESESAVRIMAECAPGSSPDDYISPLCSVIRKRGWCRD